MDIIYKDNKIEEECTNLNVAEKVYGRDMSIKIMNRIAQMRSVNNINELYKIRSARCHKLRGKRKNQFSVDLVRQYRLVFEKYKNKINVVRIIEIVDYH